MTEKGQHREIFADAWNHHLTDHETSTGVSQSGGNLGDE
jgi:hypothetical protein